jgi:membrane protease YdiL (CAAX protease family)
VERSARSSLSETRLVDVLSGRSTSARTERNYDTFLREGRIGALTLLGFFPALLLADVYLVVSRAHYIARGPLDLSLLGVTALCILFVSFYGPIGLTIGRRYALPILRGSLPCSVTFAVTSVAYGINTIAYILVHRGLTPQRDLSWNFGGLITILELCLLAPISEEIAMQGFLQTRLRRFGVFPAIAITTFIFVCMHLTEIPEKPTFEDVQHIVFAYSPILFVYALVRQITGSLFAVMVLHALNNASILLFLAK